MTERINLVAVTFKIHPRLLEEIDALVDNVHFRSRAHVINCAVDDWLNSPPKPKVVRRTIGVDAAAKRLRKAEATLRILGFQLGDSKSDEGKCRQNVADIEKKA
jgi:Arc/MetJ-type ribon-helix-helix transcriptional regulator